MESQANMEFVHIGDKAKYLKDNYPFMNVPSLDEKRYCLHCEKWIRVGDFKVEVLNGEEYIVCPNAPRCDGTVIDWMNTDHKGYDIEGNFVGNDINKIIGQAPEGSDLTDPIRPTNGRIDPHTPSRISHK